MGDNYRSARCVFVGNIPYDATEQQLIEVFQQAGPVVSFRLVFDRDTGKPKGYGFCEYRDVETALSAMRNLNNYEFNGRPLRVDFADQGGNQPRIHGGGGSGGGGATGATGPTGVQAAPIVNPNPITPNVTNPSAPATAETINGILEGLTPAQMHEIMYKMKMIVQQSPDQAKQILTSNPPLAYALLQIQVILGMINSQTVQRVLAKQQTNPAAPSYAPQPGITPTPPMTMQPQQPGIPQPTIPQGVPPGITQPVGGFPGYSGGMMRPMNPPPVMGYPPGVPNVQHYPHGYEAQQVQEQQRVIQQLMALTPAQIEQLPPDQRAQVQQIRSMLYQKYM